MNSIVEKYITGHCRKCINKQYNLDLTPQDCVYLKFPTVCKKCKEMSNIVVDIRRSKRLRLWLKGFR